MNTIEMILAALLGINVTLAIILFVVFNMFWGIASAVFSEKRGRNAWNWFFLSCIYGWYGLVLLACSKTISKEESDTLAKALWAVAIVPVVIIVVIFCAAFQSSRQEDELTRKVMEDMQMNQRNKEIIQRNENLEDKDAYRLLDDLGLSE